MNGWNAEPGDGLRLLRLGDTGRPEVDVALPTKVGEARLPRPWRAVGKGGLIGASARRAPKARRPRPSQPAPSNERRTGGSPRSRLPARPSRLERPSVREARVLPNAVGVPSSSSGVCRTSRSLPHATAPPAEPRRASWMRNAIRQSSRRAHSQQGGVVPALPGRAASLETWPFPATPAELFSSQKSDALRTSGGFLPLVGECRLETPP